jgi:hypothetical protein
MLIILLPRVSCRSSFYCTLLLTDFGSLPTGTQLPGGAVLPMSSVADFPMVLPEGKSLFLSLITGISRLTIQVASCLVG